MIVLVLDSTVQKRYRPVFFLPSVLFGYHSNAVMAVSHHDDMDTYKGYIVHSACVEHTLKKLVVYDGIVRI